MAELFETIVVFLSTEWADILKWTGVFLIWTPLFAMLYMIGYKMLFEILEWAPMKRKYDSPVVEQWLAPPSTEERKVPKEEKAFDPKFAIDPPIIFEDN